MKPVIALDNWMRSVKPSEVHTVADKADTSYAMIYQIAKGHKQASAAWAQRFVAALNAHAGKSVVTVGDLVPACASCPYFKP